MPGRTKNRRSIAEEPSEDAVMEEPLPPHQPTAEDAPADDDVKMEAEAAEEAEEEEEEEPMRVKVLPGSTPTAASFEFLDEGHTLGNALRYVIMKNPEVEFCAYAIPHPSEAKMNVRIQTTDGATAVEALEKGLRDLQDLCDVVATKFWEAREEFVNEMATEK